MLLHTYLAGELKVYLMGKKKLGGSLGAKNRVERDQNKE
jgi:hypothetical protein